MINTVFAHLFMEEERWVALQLTKTKHMPMFGTYGLPSKQITNIVHWLCNNKPILHETFQHYRLKIIEYFQEQFHFELPNVTLARLWLDRVSVIILSHEVKQTILADYLVARSPAVTSDGHIHNVGYVFVVSLILCAV